MNHILLFPLFKVCYLPVDLHDVTLFYYLFYRGPQGRLAIIANCVFLFKKIIIKIK